MKTENTQIENLELGDIQGIILRSYGTKKCASYYFLEVTDPAGAKAWLEKVADRITSVEHKSQKQFFNVAFTAPGLKALGLSPEVMNTFSPEFKEGPLDEHRRRMLGDIELNDPSNWHWAKTQQAYDSIHMLLMLYAENEIQLESFTNELEAEYAASGLKKIYTFPTHLLPDNKEHFGFRDGISQPMVAGFGKGEHPDNVVKPGEFVLGYENEYNILPDSPAVPAKEDVKNILPASDLTPGAKDLGKNGSYLVFRQIAQDVKSFWKFMENTTAENPFGTTTCPRHLASKMMGRWPNGAPVTLSPEKEDPALAKENNFNYHSNDLEGMKCPIGSHIRRTNPRDAFTDDPSKSTVFSKKHRLIRRSRTYGEPLAHTMDYKDMLEKKDEAGERGIYFICFNSSISRQFEFIQQTWVVNPKFRNLYQDPDPLMGSPELMKDNMEGYFTMPAEPARERVGGIRSFVQVKGMAYFFMPGIKGLKYIAGIK